MSIPPFLQLPLALAGGVGFGLGICLLLATVSGWRSLARTYRGRLPRVDGVAVGSATIGGVSYNGVITFATGPDGVGMWLFPPFAVGSPPIAVPWAAIDGVRRYRLLGRFDRFSFRAGSVMVTAKGVTANLLSAAWQKWGGEAGAPRP
jgi:hypothetical protein